ncbi:histidine kinase [Nakamurella sp. PAMC28650]|uniref:PAS domain-containing sensor histidine kinase n=1 Tax=Nakamurella sp. PAMC28650 TaxID=2762325 RepID=UPI00164E48EB|nr:histidine kinase [Nakamurella sp. PAMC28650]QNK81926.1 PAS domain S-box protein [Nakamurella sp. PAMC28650]
MPEPVRQPPPPGDGASSLGRAALAQLVTKASDGLCIIDAQRHFVYANPAACHMLDRPLHELRGTDFLAGIPESERETAKVRYTAQLDGMADSYSGQIRTSDGTVREIVYSNFAMTIDEKPHGIAMFRDVTAPRGAARTAAVLAQTAAQLVGTATTHEILAGIARHAYEGTRAVHAGIAVMGADHRLAFGGFCGHNGSYFGTGCPGWASLAERPPQDMVAAMTAGTITTGSVPGKAIVLPDARAVWQGDPVMAEVAAVTGDGWQVAVCLPLAWANRVIGLLGVCLPAGVAGPSEAELAFCTALADQAAVAVINARLTAEAGRAAATLERTRLARDLHDSVSQALFSMTMHARAAELTLARIDAVGTEELTQSIADLADLARGSLAQMRALIFELRPESMGEEGLIGALHLKAAALAAGEQTPIRVTGPDQLPERDRATEEQLYRIASEALYNVIQHAGAACAFVDVTIDQRARRVTVTVTDDGVGFDPATAGGQGSGLVTMANCAEAIGADLEITSGCGSGTVVAVSMALADIAARSPGA